MRVIRNIIFFGLLVFTTLSGRNAVAVPVLFDFEDVPNFAGAAVIEEYMEGIYGSDITVVGGRVLNGIIPGFIPGPLGDDHYVHATPWWGTSWFSFSFNEVPITSVSFDFGQAISSFHAYADDEECFSEAWHFWSSDNCGSIYFDSPVTTLKFSNGRFGEIEVDNIIVNSVPEPSTLLMLSLGVPIVLGLRKKR